MKLLIVDDEEYTREGLRDSFDWKGLGIREVMLARDGKAALSISRWFQPDIVITDIKMPRMDGLAFARELTGFLPQCKLLFISGYVEVDYFKRALQLSAVDYVLKPIDKQQMMDAVKRAISSIEEVRSVHRIKEDNLEMKRNRLIHLLLNEQPDLVWCERLCREVGFQPQGNFICVLITQLGMHWYNQNLFDAVEKLCKAMRVPCLMDYLQGSRYVAILREPDMAALRRRLQELVQEENVLIGVGTMEKGLRRVWESYQRAKQAQGMYYFQPDMRYVEPEMLPEHRVTLDTGLQNQFLSILRETPAELSGWFAELFRQLEAHPGEYRRQSIQGLFKALIQAIAVEYPHLLAGVNGVDHVEDVDAMVEAMETWKDLRCSVEKILDAFEKERSKRSQYSRIVQQLRKYVEEHYHDSDLTIQDMADSFHMSTTYLGILFKRETGQTLKQYINICRMNKAKKLLSEGHEKIGDIAIMCGFANANYFAHSFKESEGVTP